MPHWSFLSPSTSVLVSPVDGPHGKQGGADSKEQVVESVTVDAADSETPVMAPPPPPLPVSSPSSGTPITEGDSSDETTLAPDHNAQLKTRIGRFSFHLFSSTQFHTRKPPLTSSQESEKKKHAAGNVMLRSSPSNRRAFKSALMVRSLIVGPSNALPQLTKPVTSPQLSQVKSQLLKPKTANKVIAELRALPTSGTVPNGATQGPIRAVCLEHSDDEMNKVHFANLFDSEEGGFWSLSLPAAPSVSLGKLAALFDEMNIIDLIQTPDLGLGQPGDGPGLLAGSLPTAETVMHGVEQITPQLMALGYATGQAVLADHRGVYPPKDRMSVLTYWWGLELVLPPPSLAHLARVQSIPNTVINFLTALSSMNNGVREILPFVRYIAQYIDFEFKAIQAQNRGRGVVCAATWIMPAAMVPRPWDFPDPPEGNQSQPLKEAQAKNTIPDKHPAFPSSHPGGTTSGRTPALPTPTVPLPSE